MLFVHYCNLMVCVVYWVDKWQSRGSTGMFGNLMAIYHIMLQFIQNHSRFGGAWGCEVSCGGHHRPRGKTTTGSALGGAVFDIAQILAYLVHNMSRSQLYLGFGHFGWLPSFLVNNILAGLWLNCISSVEITLFLLADISLQHRALFQC